MAVSLKHNFQSAKSDGSDATLVQPSNWNAEHDLTLGTGKLLGRSTAGTGSAEEITPSTGLSLSGGNLTVSLPIGTVATTGGAAGQIVFDTGSVLQESASLVWDNTNAKLTVAGRATFSAPPTSAAAWTTSGINLIQSTATFTDTSSTGTVGAVAMNAFNAQTLAASNTLTVSSLYGVYFRDPIAGTNVTATTRSALAADSIYCAGALIGSGAISWSAAGSSTIALGSSTGTGAIQLGRSTVSQTVEVAQGTTASGSTKTVNIGTNGASGSTTAITLGSSTSGATQTTTVNGRVTLAPIGASVAAWTTSGVGLVQSAATFTDTSSTGTVADIRMNNFAAQTLAASNTITVSNLYGAFFTTPTAGTNVTATNRWGVGTDNLVVTGAASFIGSISSGGSGSISLGTGTSSQSLSFGTGVTASGQTKTVNIGTGGAAGSTTAITLGSTSGTSTVTINGSLSGRITPRVSTTTSSATPTINTDTTDVFGLTAQAVDITSFTTNLSGTPTDGQRLWIYIVGTAARAITWGASFEASTIPLPTTTVSTNRLDVGFVWNAATSKWRCIGSA